MSSPFVKIVDGKLNMFPIDMKDTEIRILCILGKARMGKSTFLNTFVTYLEGVQPFQTQNNDEHCTRGIDYYFCEKERIVLMDCQGLALEDSSHDPALLLFAYLVSDVIVFNERMMLQNEALKLLEPICTFMPYLEMNEQKPKLYFRISDGDMVSDVQKNLSKVIHTQYNDQYQTIRDSIQNLFQPDIGIVKTDSFDKKTKAKLQSGDYLCLLEEDLGFTEAIQILLDSLPQGKSSDTWKQNMISYIDQINRNEKISIDKLDIVGQTGKIEILEWMNALRIYKEPSVDGTQASYEIGVEPMKREKQAILTKFTRLFKAIPDSIKQTHREKLSTLLTTPITNVEKTCEIKAEQFAHDFVVLSQKNKEFPILHSVEESFTRRPDAFFQSYFEVFYRLLRSCEHLYLPVKNKYVKWVKNQLATFQIALDNVKALEKGYVDTMKKHNEAIIRSYHETILERFGKMNRRILKERPNALLGLYYTQMTVRNEGVLVTMVEPHEIKVTMKEKELTCVIGPVSKVPILDIKSTFDKIAPLTIGVYRNSHYMENGSFYAEKQSRLDWLNLKIKEEGILQERLEHLLCQRHIIVNTSESDILMSYMKRDIHKEYDLVLEESRQFEKRFAEIAFHKDLEKAATQRKIALLEGEILSEELIPFLLDVVLVTFPVGEQIMTLTQDTYDKTYGLIHEETVNTLYTKGYLSNSPWVNTLKDNRITLSIVEIPHIQYLFKHQFYKILAKEYVNGVSMPETYYSNESYGNDYDL